MTTHMVDPLDTRRLSVDRIAHAATVIDPVFLNSPQFRAESFEKQLDCRLVVKVETLNPIRSFKGRGTEYLAIFPARTSSSCLCDRWQLRSGMAYSARKRGLTLTIFASVTANPLKVERMRALGADVRLTGDDFDAAHLAATAFAAETGAQLIEDGRDARHCRGRRHDRRGAAPLARTVRCHSRSAGRWCVAGGGGAMGQGAPARHADDWRVRQRRTSMERSWRAAQVQELESANTIADGIAVRSPFPEALFDLLGVVDDILLVDDDALVTAMRSPTGRSVSCSSRPEPLPCGASDQSAAVPRAIDRHDFDRRKSHDGADGTLAMRRVLLAVVTVPLVAVALLAFATTSPAPFGRSMSPTVTC